MSENPQEEFGNLKIGAKIRAIREEKGFTLEELAQRADVSPAVVAGLEGDESAPTIATLVRIAKALGVNMSHFFLDEVPGKRLEVVRAGERRQVVREHAPGETFLSYTYQTLAYHGTAKNMQPFLVEFDLHPPGDLKPVSHEGEEFIFMLQGEVEFSTPEQTLTLHEGDSLYFDSSIPHLFAGQGSVRPRAIAVVYTPPGRE